MESHRLPRFTRSSQVAPFELTDRDRDIIRLVHVHRFLRSSHVTSLVPGSADAILRRLQLLYHHGYLERPRAQLDYYHAGGSRRIVYGLGNKGAALMAQENPGSVSKRRSGEKNRSVGRIYLEHALFVSDILVAIEIACRRNGGVGFIGAESLLTGCGQSTFRWQVDISPTVKLGVIPDSVFALERNGSRTCFFLEADRGTMPVIRKSLGQTSMYRKFLAYAATWKQSIHRSRFGFRRFRVLSVTRSPERVASLVQSCSELKHGRGLFLFGDRSAIESESILEFAWQTGRAGETSCLLT